MQAPLLGLAKSIYYDKQNDTWMLLDVRISLLLFNLKRNSIAMHAHVFFSLYHSYKISYMFVYLFNILILLLTSIVGEDNATPSRRLTYSIKEPNVARGYIKEHCFSSDGRIICSPFGNSARILGFSKHCEELATCVQETPSELCDLKTLISHKHAVVTCRFSPTHSLLSLGCLGGKVSFYQPKL